MKKKTKKYDRLHVISFSLIVFLIAIGLMNDAFSRESSIFSSQQNDGSPGGFSFNSSISDQEAESEEIHKDEIEDSGKLGFRWKDGEVANRLSVNSKGQIEWKSLRGYPAECPAGQAIRKMGDSVECIDVGSSGSDEDGFSWGDLTSFPASCPDGQVVKAVGSSLTCVDVGSSEDDLFTDGGVTTYLSSLADNLALGGTGSSAPFFFDEGNEKLSVSSVQFSGASDNLSVSNGGFLELNGDATVWDDLRVPVTSTTRGGSKIPTFGQFKDNGSGSQGVFTYWFDADSEQELYFTAQIPHNYKQGSDIYPHVHWVPAANGTSGQKVSWGLEYNWSSIGSVFGNTNIIYANDPYPADGTLQDDKHYMTGFSAIDGENKGYSSMLVCRVFRNATGAGSSSDGYTSDAGLVEIDFHYEIDKIGTDEEY